MGLMYPHDDAQSLFDYPEDRLYKPAAAIRDPDNQDLKGDLVRFVIRRGHTTFTSIGRLTGFISYQCCYGIFGTSNSVEVAMHAYDSDSSPFSRGGGLGISHCWPSSASLLPFLPYLWYGTEWVCRYYLWQRP